MNPPLRASANSYIAVNVLGQTVATSRKSGWKHPWFTTPQWFPSRKSWMAFVVAGFVNGFAPLVRTTAGDLRAAQGTFFGQLVDAGTGAAEIAQLAQLAIGNGDDSGLPDNASLDVPLYQRPPILLSDWKALGWDGSGAVPPFFKLLGVSQPPASVESQLQAGGGQIALTSPPKGNRLLRSCDIILHQPRTALTSSISLDGLTVTQVLGIRGPRDGDSLRILSGDFDQDQEVNSQAQPGTNIVANDFEEANFDEIRISTVFLLSPPDTAPGSVPDATWQPYVRHATPSLGGQGFWNMYWAQPKLDNIDTNTAITDSIAAVEFLGGGAGAVAIHYLASSIDEATNAAINLIKGNSLTGTFWTPTGGGTSSSYVLAATKPVKTGLNKASNVAAAARAAQLARTTATLDPAFPYEGRSFNLSLLNR